METQQENKTKRNIPLKNWVDSIARHQIINQAIFEEYILSIWEKRKTWIRRAQKRLKPYGIELSQATLQNYLYALKSGSRDATGTSAFGNKLFNDFGCRSGKEGMYKQMEILEHMCVSRGIYVGLPANQLLHMIRRYGKYTHACEVDPDMFKFMFAMKRHFAPEIAAPIYQSEILDFLEKTPKTFSIYDLDLMQHMKPDLIKRLAGCIARTTRDTSVVSVASCIGRSGTKEDYRTLMPKKLVKEIEKQGCLVSYTYSGGYNDSVTPMRYELLIVHR
jgi:hypothetical protein